MRIVADITRTKYIIKRRKRIFNVTKQRSDIHSAVVLPKYCVGVIPRYFLKQ